MDRDHTKTHSLFGLLDLARRLHVCQTQTTRLLERLIAHGCETSEPLRPQDLILLSFCQQQQNQGASQRELAHGTGSSPARISGRLESLRRQGLVYGSRIADDRRRQTWRLTLAGSQLLEQLERATNSDDVSGAFEAAIQAVRRSEPAQPRRDAA